MTTEELQRLSNLDWVAEQPDSANGWWVVDGADDSGDGGMYEATARDVASVPALARELIAARRVVEAAREASAALKYSENEIANLENVLSDYRQNWQEAQSAHQQLDAALSAYEEAKG